MFDECLALFCKNCSKDRIKCLPDTLDPGSGSLISKLFPYQMAPSFPWRLELSIKPVLPSGSSDALLGPEC